jgi:hypothetical protein
VQANAELIDTSSARSLWAERFQRELSDPFELQEAVTGRIAASLQYVSEFAPGFGRVRVKRHRRFEGAARGEGMPTICGCARWLI